MPTPESIYLRSVAPSVASSYHSIPGLIGVLLSGSTAEGVSDNYSDIDMMFYWENLPTEEQLARAMNNNGAGERKWNVQAREEEQLMEAYDVAGIECQLAHSTVPAWHREMDEVLVKLDIKSPNQKALSGTLSGIALFGEDLIDSMKQRAANYPAALAKAMIEGHLQFFPWWRIEDRMPQRDGTIWKHRVLVENAENLLGVLAGVNRVYFSNFQFKKMKIFLAQLEEKPDRLAERIEALFTLDRPGETMRELVRETVAIVKKSMPEVDTSGVEKSLSTVSSPWQMPLNV